jgi:hypothetical protein
MATTNTSDNNLDNSLDSIFDIKAYEQYIRDIKSSDVPQWVADYFSPKVKGNNTHQFNDSLYYSDDDDCDAYPLGI